MPKSDQNKTKGAPIPPTHQIHIDQDLADPGRGRLREGTTTMQSGEYLQVCGDGWDVYVIIVKKDRHRPGGVIIHS
jgi:hypothetical protein